MSKSTWRATASALGIAVLALAGTACGGDDEASAEPAPVPATSAAPSPTASSEPTPTAAASTASTAGGAADLDRIAELCEAMSGPDGAMRDAIAATRDGDTTAAQTAVENALEQVRDLAEQAEPYPRLAEGLDDYADAIADGGLDEVADARPDVDAGCYAAAADVG